MSGPGKSEYPGAEAHEAEGGYLLPRLDSLLIDWSTQGLTPPEEAEVRELLTASAAADLSAYDPVASFELAAAAVHLTSPALAVPMPAAIEAKIQEQARKFFAMETPATALSGAEVRNISSPPATARGAASTSQAGSFGRSLGWLAAAACLALAVIGWWPRFQELPVSVDQDPVATMPRAGTPPEAGPLAVVPTLEERVTAAQDVLRLPWTVTEDPAVSPEASGEILWSNELQAGVMRFAGLQANDPSEFQYQLWIFDQEQDERFPVDGGVFDIEAGAENLVPIQAKLGISEPKLFAVTVEKPGGVVVSSRERIVVLAQVS